MRDRDAKGQRGRVAQKLRNREVKGQVPTDSGQWGTEAEG